jgi:hypothetical protein
MNIKIDASLLDAIGTSSDDYLADLAGVVRKVSELLGALRKEISGNMTERFASSV